jgi:phosphatidylglycerol:prolipoprotein diacylglycerol transferase
MLTRTLFHIWGPFSIYTYGAFIALGCIIFYYLALAHPKRASIISESDAVSLFSWSILFGVIGARILYLISSYSTVSSLQEVIMITNGGFSLLGTVIALLIFIPYYLKKRHIPILPLLDLVSIYAPLLQAISRLGCFFAGCCYGRPSSVLWAIKYSDPDTLAPLNCWLHPTQLYSAFSLFIIFIVLYIGQSYIKKSGLLFCFYLILSNLSRFLIDFVRDDREFLNNDYTVLSIHQWIALLLIIGASIMYLVILRNKRNS